MINDAQNVCLKQQFMTHEGDNLKALYSYRAYNWYSLAKFSPSGLMPERLGQLSDWSDCSSGSLIAAAVTRLEAKVSL